MTSKKPGRLLCSAFPLRRSPILLFLPWLTWLGVLFLDRSVPRLVSSELPSMSTQEVLHASAAARQTVFVTGGMGNIGKYIVRELLTLGFYVVSMDIQDRMSEQVNLCEERGLSAQLSQLEFVQADIRNESAVGSLLVAHPGLVGIIHLAAVATMYDCLQDEHECYSVNAAGTQVILEEVKAYVRKMRGKVKRPWLLFTSSSEIYGNSCHPSAPCNESSSPNPNDLYGATKLQGEDLLRLGSESFGGTLILRLSSVYGGIYDPRDRLIPMLSLKAMSDAVVDLPRSETVFDFVHMNDVVSSVLRGVRLLKSQPHSQDLVLICSGQMSTLQDALDWSQFLAQGQSPIRIMPHGQRSDQHFVCDNSRMRNFLERSPLVPDLKQGLAIYMHDVYTKDLGVLKESFQQRCSQAQELDLPALEGCRVFIMSLNEPSYLKHLSADGATRRKVLGNGVFLNRTAGSDRHFTITFERTMHTANLSGRSVLFRAWPHGTSAGYLLMGRTMDGAQVVLDKSLEVVMGEAKDAASVSIWPYSCPPKTTGHAHLPTEPFEPAFSLLREVVAPEDPLPRRSDRPLACDRLAEAITAVQLKVDNCMMLRLTWPSNSSLSTSAYVSAVGAYSLAYRPLCDSDCRLISRCIKSPGCRCIDPSCQPKTYLASPSAPPSPLKGIVQPQERYNNLQGFPALPQMLKGSKAQQGQVVVPFSSLLTKSAAPFYFGWSPPKVHVLDIDFFSLVGETSDAEATSFATDQNCFCADHLLYLGLKKLNVASSDAEAIFMPFYSGWLYHYKGKLSSIPTYLDQMNDKVKQLVGGTETPIKVYPMTHDYGGALNFQWDMREARDEPQRLQQTMQLRDSIVLSPFGDFNTVGYLPHKDVVVPQSSCLTPLLIEHFSRDEQVKPILERKHFLSFHGSADTRTGSAARTALLAGTLFPRSQNRVSLRPAFGMEYLRGLNDSIFCPHIFGTTGWATRLQDAIYCGCIPVLTSDITHPPFYDVLDWHKFSVFTDWRNLEQLEDNLLNFAPEELQKKQDHLLQVRQAFVYEESGQGNELEGIKKGPLFMTLLSLKLRLATRVPAS